jgi:hypothetical protein
MTLSPSVDDSGIKLDGIEFLFRKKGARAVELLGMTKFYCL